MRCSEIMLDDAMRTTTTTRYSITHGKSETIKYRLSPMLLLLESDHLEICMKKMKANRECVVIWLFFASAVFVVYIHIFTLDISLSLFAPLATHSRKNNWGIVYDTRNVVWRWGGYVCIGGKGKIDSWPGLNKIFFLQLCRFPLFLNRLANQIY